MASGNTNCYALFIAVPRTRRSSRPDLSTDKTIQELTKTHFPDGFSVARIDGGWLDPATGKFRREESREVTVCTDKNQRVIRWAKALAAACRQKELLVVKLGRASRVRAAGKEKRGGR